MDRQSSIMVWTLESISKETEKLEQENILDPLAMNKRFATVNHIFRKEMAGEKRPLCLLLFYEKDAIDKTKNLWSRTNYPHLDYYFSVVLITNEKTNESRVIKDRLTYNLHLREKDMKKQPKIGEAFYRENKLWGFIKYKIDKSNIYMSDAFMIANEDDYMLAHTEALKFDEELEGWKEAYTCLAEETKSEPTVTPKVKKFEMKAQNAKTYTAGDILSIVSSCVEKANNSYEKKKAFFQASWGEFEGKENTLLVRQIKEYEKDKQTVDLAKYHLVEMIGHRNSLLNQYILKGTFPVDSYTAQELQIDTKNDEVEKGSYPDINLHKQVANLNNQLLALLKENEAGSFCIGNKKADRFINLLNTLIDTRSLLNKKSSTYDKH